MGNNVKFIICTRNGNKIRFLFLRPNAISKLTLVDKQI